MSGNTFPMALLSVDAVIVPRNVGLHFADTFDPRPTCARLIIR